MISGIMERQDKVFNNIRVALGGDTVISVQGKEFVAEAATL